MASDGLCECGCGDPAPISPSTNRYWGWSKGQPKRFIAGHQARVKRLKPRQCGICGMTFQPRTSTRQFCSKHCAGKANSQKGAESRHFRGGVFWDTTASRWAVTCRDGTKMAYSRAVMAGHIGRLLETNEVVHHVNRDPTDDRIENLQLLSPSQHTAVHAKEMLEARWGEAT